VRIVFAVSSPTATREEKRNCDAEYPQRRRDVEREEDHGPNDGERIGQLAFDQCARDGGAPPLRKLGRSSPSPY
jgi:hypothetical protein